MLADPGGEYESVEAAQRRGKPGNLTGDPEGEQLDCFLGLLLITLQKHAAVGADAGSAQQTRTVIEEILDFARISPGL